MKFDFRKYEAIYTADFETSTPKWFDAKYQKDNYNIKHSEPERARIWAWDICYDNTPMYSKTKLYGHLTGTNMETFIATLKRFKDKSLIAFHNLAFDGTYILSWLLANGYSFNADAEKLHDMQFNTCISDMGQHYAYDICFNGKHITIMDSYKYIMASVKAIAKMYNLPIQKGECDYNRYRFPDEPISNDDLKYIHNDTEIMLRAIHLNLDGGQIKFTQAGNAKYEFRKTFKQDDYEYYFPEITSDEDDFIRRSYVGGFTYVNPLYQGKDLGEMISMDYNSMYPSQMLFKPMPYGEPEYCIGKFEIGKTFPKCYDVCIQHFACRFYLKDKHIPMIATKRLFLRQPDAYMYSSDGKQVELYLSSPDIELFFMNYDAYDIEWIDFMAFRSKCGVFTDEKAAKGMSVDDIIRESGKGSLYHDYFLKWRTIKEHAPIGSVERAIAKRMQNALYGAEASNPRRRQDIPYLNEDGVLSYKTDKANDGKPMYLPAAVFTTAWSRYEIITAILNNIDRFVYCDTDSLYLLGHDIPDNIKIHDSLYGFFKVEHIIERARFLGAKRYIYYARTPKSSDYKWEVACCGASEEVKNKMCWDNFKPNTVFEGKLTMKTIQGGKHLVETTYKLKV